MFAAAAIAILVTMAMALARAFLGPTVFDRLLAVNMLGTKTVLLIAVLGFLTGRPDFLDIALVYALIAFIGTVAVLSYRHYSDAPARSGPGEGGPGAGEDTEGMI